MKYLYHRNLLIRTAASLALVTAIAAIAVVASGCSQEPCGPTQESWAPETC
jgi:PBP1b-binding outer membrane lipoprotein LpoB